MVTKIQNVKENLGPTGKDWFFFIIKLFVIFLIGDSFVRLEAFYESNRFLYNLAIGFNTFLSANVLISVGRFLLISWYSRRIKASSRVRGNIVLGINQFSGILNTIFVVIGIMLAFAIHPKEFLTSITLVAMAIALLFKDYITNMISGLIIMFSDQFTIGDFIKIGDYQGRIIDITLSNIVIKNEDDDVVLIPNNSAFNLNIVNRTFDNSRKFTIDFKLSPEKAEKFDGLQRHLLVKLRSLDEQIQEDSIQFRVIQITHNEVEFKLLFQLASKSSVKKNQIKTMILSEILRFDYEEKKPAPDKS